MNLRPAVLPLAAGLTASAAAGDDPAAVQAFPPAADRQAAPGTGIWVLFALQPNGRPAAWELRLDGAEPALVKRCEFAPSSWAPDFLFGRAPEPAPELVRFQCRAAVPPPGYVVPLFRIDYRTWDVKPLVVSRQVHGLAAFPELAWLATADGVRVFERGTGTLRAAKQELRPIRTWDDAWLIERPGGASGARTASAGGFRGFQFP